MVPWMTPCGLWTPPLRNGPEVDRGLEMDEWDQRIADSRSIVKMRRIAQEAMCFGDDNAACHAYADQHKLTVNEIVYYVNAYEAGGDQGLHALRAPDSIPPEVARRARKTIAAMLEEWSPDLPYRCTDEGTAIGVYEIKQRRSGDKYLSPICQLRLTVTSMHWHLYWMRSFDAWWPYSLPEHGRKYTLRARLQQVLEDGFGCFWA
jgi:hypothetical protein